MPMQTTLIQTHRTENRPPWISDCLASAEAWASANSWAYHLRGDEIFELVPPKILAKFAHQIPLQIDIARMLWARSHFDEHPKTERIIWLDADVYVFDPSLIHIDPTLDFAVGRQIWIQPDGTGKLKTYKQVHNAILVFKRSTPVLDFLIQAAMTLAQRHQGPATPQLLGPKLLTALHNIVGFSVIESIGMASPLVLADIAAGTGSAMDRLVSASPAPLGAANLCSSYLGQTIDGVSCTDDLFVRAIQKLKSDGLT